MKRLIIPALVIISLMFISLVSANLIVTPEPTPAIKFNESHTFYTSVYDNNTGEAIISASCNLSLYNSSGSLLSYTSYVYTNPSYSLTLNNGNFTNEDILTYKIYCLNSGVGGSYSGNLIINTNGKGEPSGIVIVTFISIFLSLFLFGIVYLIKVIALLSNLSVDLLDVGYMWGVFFGLLALLRLETIYLGSVEFQSWINFFTSIPVGIAFMLIPAIAFFISLIANKKKVNKEKAKW